MMLFRPDGREHFTADRPAATHWRRAECAEVNCPQWERGWVTTVDIATKLGEAQAGYIRYQSGRRFVEERMYESIVQFKFYAGQTCFREHRIPMERGPILTRNGRVQEFDQWTDGWNENAYRLHKLRTGRG